MSDPMTRHHGLEPFLGEVARELVADSGARLTIRGDLGHINLRGNPDNTGFVTTVEEVLGQSLPVAPNTFSIGTHRIFWLGPDEWLVVTAAVQASTVAERLHEVTSEYHAAVNDTSGGQVAMLLEGSAARRILAKGCTLDLHASVFAVGTCAQSGLAKASVLLGLLDDAPTFMIVVRRSFSDYLCRWLANAGGEAGIRFSQA